MKSSQSRQYTVRNLTPSLDKALRQRAKEKGQSLNEAILETLKKGTGLSEKPLVHHDLDSLIGTWEDDPVFEEALRGQDQIDPKVWS